MKNISKLMVAVLALGSSAWMVTAQPDNAAPSDSERPLPPEGAPPGGPGMRPHRPPPPFLKALDANADGVVDADELANAVAALKTLDKNGDGKLTPDELFMPRPEGQPPADGQQPPRPKGPPPGAGFDGSNNRPPPPPIIAELDANHDGVIDADEMANAPAALKTLDKNGDGKLTPDEFLPLRRGGPGGPGMRGPRGFRGPPPGDQPPPSQDAPQQ
jgi:hypothetical protein